MCFALHEWGISQCSLKSHTLCRNDTTCLPHSMVLHKEPGALYHTVLYVQPVFYSRHSDSANALEASHWCVNPKSVYFYCLQLRINECKLVGPPIGPGKQVINCDEALLEGRRGKTQGSDRKGRAGGMKEKRRREIEGEDAVWREKTL